MAVYNGTHTVYSIGQTGMELEVSNAIGKAAKPEKKRNIPGR
jgi:hypothetical protein